MQQDPAPVARFYRVIDQAPAPQRADRAGGGTLPVRAAQYCDAVTQASGFGWWIYPPLAISLLWDGAQVHWTYPGQETWLPLEAAKFPHLRAECPWRLFAARLCMPAQEKLAPRAMARSIEVTRLLGQGRRRHFRDQRTDDHCNQCLLDLTIPRSGPPRADEAMECSSAACEQGDRMMRAAA